MGPKTPPPPTFRQQYREHFRDRGSLLLADATLMIFVVLPPIALALGLKLMAVSDISPALLHVAGVTDGVWLVVAVAIICFDSAGKLLVLTVSSWRTRLGRPTP